MAGYAVSPLRELYNPPMENLHIIQKIAVLALPVLFAITVHEAAHGWMAGRLGDKTAQMLGRVTLNPIKHIDPIGTVLLPLLMAIFAGFLFGWAKPVPVTWRNLHQPKRDMGLVALAGPGANLVMAVGWALLVKLGAVLWPVTMWVALPLALARSLTTPSMRSIGGLSGAECQGHSSTPLPLRYSQGIAWLLAKWTC